MLDQLAGGNADIAFPFPRPDCNAEPDLTMCQTHYFSDPIFPIEIMVYVDRRREDAPVRLADLEGGRICRPAGYPQAALNANGRNWVRGNRVLLAQPKLVSDCIFLLLKGDVDAVVLNRMTAERTIGAMGLSGRIGALSDQPLARGSLHAVVRRDHPRARALLDVANAALARAREKGALEQIVLRNSPTGQQGN
jgi:polar amino acid transport system substrate-binding protein